MLSLEGRWLELSSALVDALDKAVGKTRNQFLEMLGGAGDAPPLAMRGLCHVLEKRLVLEERADLSEIRARLFDRRMLRSQAWRSMEDFEAGVARVKAEIFETPHARLYNDLPENDVVVKVNRLTPVQLIRRYNLELIQGLCTHAEYLDIELMDVQVRSLRHMLRMLKFHGLLYELTGRSPSRMKLRVNGVLAGVGAPTRYRTGMATFVGVLFRLDRFLLKARVCIDGKGGVLSIDESTPCLKTGPDFHEYVPKELKAFGEKINVALESRGYRPHMVELPPGPAWTWFVPDFSWVHPKTGEALHAEVFQEHQGSLLNRRLHQVSKLPAKGTIWAVDAKLLKGRSLAGAPPCASFRSLPSANKWLKQLESQGWL